jgi:hypothetical protein
MGLLSIPVILIIDIKLKFLYLKDELKVYSCIYVFLIAYFII